MPFFSKVFKNKDSASKRLPSDLSAPQLSQPQPKWDDAWQRKDVEPEEVQELLRGCMTEIKSRALDVPFLLLPFRPASDPSAARTFVRNFFGNGIDRPRLQGEQLMQELKLIEPMVLCSVLKWCWSRLRGGVVTWETYEMFRMGEKDSNMARNAFATFIPMAASKVRVQIIVDFFEFIAAIAAHGKNNGFGGRKLSRYAGWWAFEHSETGNGFDGSYRTWSEAADANAHLFFAYLRSLSPDSVQGKNGVATLPLSLQNLLEKTEYPPVAKSYFRAQTSKVVMIVDAVSPTPFALLRRAKNFQYREDDYALQQFSNFEDPVEALTDECRRVLKCISNANDSLTSKESTSVTNPSWSRFEDIGFGDFGVDSEEDDLLDGSAFGKRKPKPTPELRSTPQSRQDLGRPTTPSWADFLSTGFNAENNGSSPALLLPPDKVLPPIVTRSQTSASAKRAADDDSSLEPGELASIIPFKLDDAFWWVWISSLAGEEPVARKAAFGRCTLIETKIAQGPWMLMEEVVKGAAPEPDAGAYIAEKKSRFGFSKRGRLTRSKSSAKPMKKEEIFAQSKPTGPSKPQIAPDQQARIQAAAAALQRNQNSNEKSADFLRPLYGTDDPRAASTQNLQPVIVNEAAPAMKWAKTYDKNAIRAKYLGDNFAGRGSNLDISRTDSPAFDNSQPGTPSMAPTRSMQSATKPLTPRADENKKMNLPSPGLDKKELPPSPETPAKSSKGKEKASPPPPPPEDTKPMSPIDRKPLPEKDSPIRQKSPVENKPLPSQNLVPERTASKPANQKPLANNIVTKPATNGTAPKPSEPESPADDGKGKKKAPGAIKSLFGRKKPEETKKPSIEPPPRNSSQAVAAARAALEAKAKQSSAFSSPPKKIVNKRYSAAGPVPVEESGDIAQKDLPLPPAKDNAPSRTSTIDPQEALKAEHEFSRFDQGPLDMPDQMPADTPEGIETPPARGHDAEPEIEQHQQYHNSHHEEANGTADKPADGEAGEGDKEEFASPQDRWAQIRKNAAERAARHSDEKGDVPKVDESEGEESIETRVARIKARVAELTGNMEMPANKA